MHTTVGVMQGFHGYAVEKKQAKRAGKVEFGTQGAIEGVAGSQAANDVTVTVTMAMLALSIPTSNTTAILLGLFQNFGIQPGPQLFTTPSSLVGLWVKLLKLPKPCLHAGALIFAVVGVYGVHGLRQSAFDLFLLCGIGALASSA